MANDKLYACSEVDLFTELAGSRDGLTTEVAAERLREVGPNAVAAGRHHTFLGDILERCRNPLAIQLLVIALVSYLMGDLRSAVVVGGMLVLSVSLAYFQETRSTRAVEQLQKLVKTTTDVIRDVKQIEVPLEEIVPGDVVVLAAGSLIPADIRILSAKDFFVTQSALTGESMPVEKSAELPAAGKTPLESPNACFMGSNVLSGSARAVVLTTGTPPTP